MKRVANLYLSQDTCQ